MEGPWMIKRNGKYILFTASPYRAPKRGEPTATPPDLAQGYWVGAAVADTPWGPYRKQPQVFLGGHIAVFTGPDGTDWFSYRGESGGQAQGQLCIDPIPFNPDGSVKPFLPSAGSHRRE
jgi:xylan 1,4-beta-xylosidase